MSRPTTPTPQSQYQTDAAPNAASKKSTSSALRAARPHLTHHLTHTGHHLHRHDKNNGAQSAVQANPHSHFGEILSKTASRTLPESLITGSAPSNQHLHNPNATSQKHTVDSNPRNTSTGVTSHSGDDLLTPRDSSTAAASTTTTRLHPSTDSSAAIAAAVRRRKWNELQHLRALRSQTESDLHQTLSSLSKLSTTTVRRLDYTYYALLTSLTTLRNGITNLHALCHSSWDLSSRFRSRASDLTQETEAALGSANEEFERQAKRITELEARLQRSRERAKACTERMESVKKVIDECRATEQERRKRRRGWWRRALGMLCFTGIVMIVIMGMRVHTGVGDGGGAADHEGFWGLEMDNGTVGADGLKSGLEELRDSTNGWDALDSHPDNPSDRHTIKIQPKLARAETLNNNNNKTCKPPTSSAGQDSNERETTCPREGPVDSEATMRLFDQL